MVGALMIFVVFDVSFERILHQNLNFAWRTLFQSCSQNILTSDLLIAEYFFLIKVSAFQFFLKGNIYFIGLSQQILIFDS